MHIHLKKIVTVEDKGHSRQRDRGGNAYSYMRICKLLLKYIIELNNSQYSRLQGEKVLNFTGMVNYPAPELSTASLAHLRSEILNEKCK